MTLTHKVIRRNGTTLRDGPGTEFSIVNTLRSDTHLSILKQRGIWAVVDLKGDGYVDGFVIADDLAALGFSEEAASSSVQSRAEAPASDVTESEEAIPAADAVEQGVPIVSQRATRDNDRETGLEAAGATETAESSSLVARLDTSYKPVSGWKITENSGTRREFFLSCDGLSAPLKLGYGFTYREESPPTLGLARTSSFQPKLPFEPQDWKADFGFWPELLYPTAWAESNADFLVVNAWDAAAMTFGFIQLAAHTPDDLIPFFKRLLRTLPDEMRVWFPELALVGGTLSFVQNGSHKSLENARRPTDGARSANYYRGDFMEYLNPSRRMIDVEELHAAARWIEWTRRSKKMQREQVESSIENMKSSLALLHRELLRHASAKYPRGVDGMRCDHLAAAIAVPHLSEAMVGKAVEALKATDVLAAFRTLRYGPGDRAKNVVAGVEARGTRLSSLRYSLADDGPEDRIAVESVVRERREIPSDEAAAELFQYDDGHADPEVADNAEGAASMLEASSNWRVAKSLLALRDQINQMAPNRNKSSDGTIGDDRHCRGGGTSDHCPNVRDGGIGVVTAMDITDDKAHGCSAQAIVDSLYASRDARIKYIIWNKRIANSSAVGGAAPWTWRRYTGSNPHDRHFHVSVKPTKNGPSGYDTPSLWTLPLP